MLAWMQAYWDKPPGAKRNLPTHSMDPSCAPNPSPACGRYSKRQRLNPQPVADKRRMLFLAIHYLLAHGRYLFGGGVLNLETNICMFKRVGKSHCGIETVDFIQRNCLLIVLSYAHALKTSSPNAYLQMLDKLY